MNYEFLVSGTIRCQGCFNQNVLKVCCVLRFVCASKNWPQSQKFCSVALRQDVEIQQLWRKSIYFSGFSYRAPNYFFPPVFCVLLPGLQLSSLPKAKAKKKKRSPSLSVPALTSLLVSSDVCQNIITCIKAATFLFPGGHAQPGPCYALCSLSSFWAEFHLNS